MWLQNTCRCFEATFKQFFSPLGEILRVNAARLLHRKLIAIQVAFQRLAQFIGGAVQYHFQNAGVGGADGFVLVGLQAELADALHMLQLAQHVVKMLFHAGDLNNWHWEEESTPEEIAQMEGDFKKELNDLAQLAPRLDLAMFPVDPRMGGDFMRGARQFLDRIPTSCFVPMHFWAQPQKVAPFKPYAESKKTRFVLLGEPGENYEL